MARHSTLIVRDPHDYAIAVRWAKPVFTTAVGLIVVLFFAKKGLWNNDVWVSTIGFSAIAFGFGAVLIGSLGDRKRDILPRGLVFGPLQFFGKYSYALYVFHQPVALLLPEVGISARTLPHPNQAPIVGLVLYLLIALSVSMGVALLS